MKYTFYWDEDAGEIRTDRSIPKSIPPGDQVDLVILELEFVKSELASGNKEIHLGSSSSCAFCTFQCADCLVQAETGKHCTRDADMQAHLGKSSVEDRAAATDRLLVRLRKYKEQL